MKAGWKDMAAASISSPSPAAPAPWTKDPGPLRASGFEGQGLLRLVTNDGPDERMEKAETPDLHDLSDLDGQIMERIAAYQEQKSRKEELQRHFLDQFHRRYQAYNVIADRVVETIIRPRIERLGRYFENAKVPEPALVHRHQCLCSIAHRFRSSASVKLELAVSRDGQCENLLLLYDLEIIPVVFHFKNKDQASMPLGSANDQDIALWVDERIKDFVDAYLRFLEFLE